MTEVQPTKPLLVLFCYAHEDEILLNKLKIHLITLQRQKIIQMWHDRDISAGAEWEQEISKYLNAADIILLLISPDFIASDYCFDIEMVKAIKRHEYGDTRVIPVILRPVDWQGTPFSKLQALPIDAKPIISSKWPYPDEAFLDVAEGVRKVAEELIIKKLKREERIAPIPNTSLTSQPLFVPNANSIDSKTAAKVSLMSDEELKQHVAILFQRAIEQTMKHPALQKELIASRDQLDQPVRVAVVGHIKTGKSTLINALLGETILNTGATETTLNVNWLRYASHTSLTIHFDNESRTPEHTSPEDFMAFIKQNSKDTFDYLSDVKYIQSSYPHPVLQLFDLIDTPGRSSGNGNNAGEVLELVKNSPTGAQEHINADIVLCLFSPSLSADENPILEDLLQMKVAPINSIGVLTKIDQYWSSHNDALDSGSQIISRLQNDHPRLGHLFFDIVPISGLLAWGAQTLTSEEFVTLSQLAKLPEERIERLLANTTRFVTRDYEAVSISTEAKQAVFDRLGAYGIWRSCQILRSRVSDRQVLTQKLLESSGLPKLQRLILSAFGNRTYWIKFAAMLYWLYDNLERAYQYLPDTDREFLDNIANQFQLLLEHAHPLREMALLKSYYEGKLSFTEHEISEILHITGEYGISDSLLLNLGKQASRMEMMKLAEKRMLSWRKRSLDFVHLDHTSMSAANTMAQSYERLLHHLREIDERTI